MQVLVAFHIIIYLSNPTFKSIKGLFLDQGFIMPLLCGSSFQTSSFCGLVPGPSSAPFCHRDQRWCLHSVCGVSSPGSQLRSVWEGVCVSTGHRATPYSVETRLIRLFPKPVMVCWPLGLRRLRLFVASFSMSLA